MTGLRPHIKCQNKNCNAGILNPITDLTFSRSYILQEKAITFKKKKRFHLCEFEQVFFVTLKFQIARLTNAQ